MEAYRASTSRTFTRASVEPVDWRGSLRMAFAEASNGRDARMMVAGIVAILEHRSLAGTPNRISGALAQAPVQPEVAALIFLISSRRTGRRASNMSQTS